MEKGTEGGIAIAIVNIVWPAFLDYRRILSQLEPREMEKRLDVAHKL